MSTQIVQRGQGRSNGQMPGVNPVPNVARVSQGTAVEMSRAAAEVLAAIQVAQAVPRDEVEARRQMREACSQMGLAKRAFYSYPRGRETITGPTVYLAQELARIWGHVDYGIRQLRVDYENHESEIEAFAWDVQTGTRSRQLVIVSHRREVNRQMVALTTDRDVYENDTNMGARRMRSALYRILPRSFTDEAEEACRETLSRGESGVRFDQRVENIIGAFRQGDISERQLVEKVDRPRKDWTVDDVVELEILFDSLKRRTITRDEAFPPMRVTAQEIITQANAGKPAPATPPTVPAGQAAAQNGSPAPSGAGGDYDPELGTTIPPGVGVQPGEFPGH